MLDETSTIAIVGASLAGLRAAESLRAEGFRGKIVQVGAEKHLPYDRPPLSKQFLAGKWGFDRVRLREPEKIEALDLDLRLGRTAFSLDVDQHRIELDDGSEVRYDGAVLATGAYPRLLPGQEKFEGVHVLRTLEDSESLSRATAEPGVKLVVVGAGFIGSEVAATCHARGAEVTLVEALPVPLERALGEEVGRACASLHEANGVELRTGVGVSELREGEVELADGSVLAADVVLVGIGVIPATQWLESSELEIDDGVIADGTLHVADDVVVAGDIARWYDEAVQKHVRIEHWTNASEQGTVAALSLLAGRDAKPYVPVPYVWSDQYDVKIQILGLPEPDDEVLVVDGSFSERRFVALYGREGKLTGAIGFSRPKKLMGFRQLLEKGTSFDEAVEAARN